MTGPFETYVHYVAPLGAAQDELPLLPGDALGDFDPAPAFFHDARKMCGARLVARDGSGPALACSGPFSHLSDTHYAGTGEKHYAAAWRVGPPTQGET